MQPSCRGNVGWTGVALVAMIGMQAVYWLVTHPINRFWLKGQRLPAASAGFFGIGGSASATEHDAADWVRLRDRWEHSHVLRACLATFGLVSLAIAVTTQVHGAIIQ
jgi:anthrone oxygenase-like protein